MSLILRGRQKPLLPRQKGPKHLKGLVILPVLKLCCCRVEDFATVRVGENLTELFYAPYELQARLFRFGVAEKINCAM